MRGRRREAAIGIGAPALLLLGAIFPAGLWDPYELVVADLARRAAIHVFGAHALELAGSVNAIPTLGDVGHNELPITSIALGFRLFGLSAWAGRLPLALWAIAAVIALWTMLARMIAPRAATYATLSLVTLPLFFVHARTLLGDVVTMAGLALAFAGLGVTLLDQRDDDPSVVRVGWLATGTLGLVAGFLSRGALVGVALPAIAVSLAWAHAWSSDRRKCLISPIAAIVTGLVGLGAAAAAIRALVVGDPRTFDVLVGSARVLGQRYPTFDAVLAVLGHALFPASAFLPLAFGRSFAAGESQREDRARSLVAIGLGLAYVVYAGLAPSVGLLPFGAVALVGATLGIALFDFERGARPSPALAAATALFGLVLTLDFRRAPEVALSVFGVPNFPYPDSGDSLAAKLPLVAGGALIVGVGAALAFGDDDAPEDGTIPAARSILRELGRVWDGNLAFFATMIEAALAGVAGLVALADPLRSRGYPAPSLGAAAARVALHAWWIAPLGALAGLLVALLFRRIPAFVARRFALRRAHLAAGALVVAGLVPSVGYYPAIAAELTPKAAFSAYERLRRPGEEIGLFGVAGRGAAYYLDGDARAFGDPLSAFAWLVGGSGRRFLAVRAADFPRMNALYRGSVEDVGGVAATDDHDVPVVGGSRSQVMLLSNELGPGETSQNPLARDVGRTVPPVSHVVAAELDASLEVVGWDVRDRAGKVVTSVVPGDEYELSFTYRVVAPIGGDWHAFVHVDGYGKRWNGDHEPLGGRYPTSLWRPGDVIVDRLPMTLEASSAPGTYTLYFGFAAGDTRMPVTRGSEVNGRVDGGHLTVR